MRSMPLVSGRSHTPPGVECPGRAPVPSLRSKLRRAGDPARRLRRGTANPEPGLLQCALEMRWRAASSTPPEIGLCPLAPAAPVARCCNYEVLEEAAQLQGFTPLTSP